MSTALNTSQTFPFVKTALAVLAALFISLLCIIKIKIALVLSAALFGFVVFWLVSKYLDAKRVVIIFILIYPLLPYLFGINIGGGVPVFRAHRIAILGLMVFLMSKGLLIRYYTEFIKTNLFSYPLLFVILSSFLTAFLSKAVMSTFFFIFSFIFELLLLAVVVFSIFRTREDIESLIKTLCVSALLLCVFGLVEKITQFNVYTTFGAFSPELSRALSLQIRDGTVRIQGPFDHSIAFGGYLVAMLPLIMYRYRGNIVYFNAVLAMIMAAVISTQSRSAILMSCLICAFYFFFIGKKNFMPSLVLIIPVLIVFAGDISTFVSRINPLSSTSQDAASSTSARYMQLVHMFNVIKQNPVFGAGITPPPGIMLQYNVIENSIDNFYLLYTYFFGIVGILSYLVFIMTTIIKPFTRSSANLRRDTLMILVLTGIVSFYLINTIVALWSFHFVYWILLGILARLIVNSWNETCSA